MRQEKGREGGGKRRRERGREKEISKDRGRLGEEELLLSQVIQLRFQCMTVCA